MKIFIAGHNGMVGKALVGRWRCEANAELILRTRAELDLTNQSAVEALFAAERPDMAIIAAAKVGGIQANVAHATEFLRENMLIATNTIHAAYRHGVARLVYIASASVYPKEASQPMAEEALLTGTLEGTNEAYALAKIIGIKLCHYYRKQYGVLFHSIVPANLFGPGDNYNLQTAHVLPAMIRRFYEARVSGQEEVTLWGSGTPRREFLYVDDLAEACTLLARLENPPDWINVGSGKDIAIREAAEAVAAVVGYTGTLKWDVGRPDGPGRKLLDSDQLLALGWRPRISFQEGLERTYRHFITEMHTGTLRR